MRNLFVTFIVIVVCAFQGLAQSPHQKFQAVPFTDVQFDDSFWSPRLQINRETAIPHNFQWCEQTNRFTNFAKAAGLMEGEFQGIYYNDSDVYKLLEGTAYSLADHPDPELEKRADAVIAWIAAAQEPDGYLNSYFTLREPDRKWTRQGMHELYCAGHLIEAAIAWKQATGKDSLLNVAEKFVDHIIDVFVTNKSSRFSVPGHQEIELALVKLYQYTDKEKYLTLAQYFIDVRGDQSKRREQIYGPYSQDHLPVRRQFEAVGHAVRAGYQYAGTADIAAHTGDRGLIGALDRLWNDVADKKMYITGGIGSRRQGEAFGEAYELPNRSAYCETCAAISLVFWGHRMNLLHGDAKYADVVERALYNGILSGIGRDGKSFFYVNPLESVGNHHRQPFFSTACCPTNVVRFVPSLPGYQYATQGNTIIVNHFVAGETAIELPEGVVKLKQETNYPWQGNVKLTFESTPKPNAAKEFTLNIRVPGWKDGKGSSYIDPIRIPWGETFVQNVDFPMETKRMISHPNVVTNRGRVALQRGPLVYCFEQIDNEVPVLQIRLARDPEFKEEFKPDLLGGIVVLKCKNADGQELTAVPYYAWDHREPGAMAVWVRQAGLSRQQPPTTEDNLYAELTSGMLRPDDELAEEVEIEVMASHCNPGDSADAVIDGLEPKNSNDHDIPRMTFWDHRGTAEWIELDFGGARKVSQTSVYWFDDMGRGQCRVPRSWTLSYRSGDQWVPVKTTGTFGVARDRYNTVEFEAVETPGLRLDIQLQEGVSGGILEWKFE